MNKEAYEKEETEEEHDIDKIPEYRAFGLYVMLVCGVIISLTGVYTKVFSIDKTASLYYDGEAFRVGAIDGIYYMVTGIIICIFTAWQLMKGNHKAGKGHNREQ